MATAAAGGPTAATARNYIERYTRLPDAMGGAYSDLYTRHSMITESANRLHRHSISSKDVVPKVYLYHTTVGGKPTIAAIHRPSTYEAHPVNPSNWDDEAFIFKGDLMPGNYITMMSFPDSVFDRTAPQTIPTVAAMDALVGALRNDEYYVPAPAENAADTEQVRTRNIIQVPYPYIPLVLKREGTPKQYWIELGGAIRNDNREAELKPLMDWLRVSLTQSRDEDNIEPPENCMGDRAEAMPALAIDDERLQAHRWDILCRDLQGLNPPPQPSDTDRVMALVNAMQQETQRERAAAAAARDAATADKLPSDTFPLVHQRWMSITSSNAVEDLPPIYHSWSNGTKGERRPALQAAFDRRAGEATAATNLSPIATKEIFEMIMQGRIGPQVHQLSDLTVGLSPFTCGFFIGQKGNPVEIRTERYDMAMAGHAAPTIAEQTLPSLPGA